MTQAQQFQLSELCLPLVSYGFMGGPPKLILVQTDVLGVERDRDSHHQPEAPREQTAVAKGVRLCWRTHTPVIWLLAVWLGVKAF